MRLALARNERSASSNSLTRHVFDRRINILTEGECQFLRCASVLAARTRCLPLPHSTRHPAAYADARNERMRVPRSNATLHRSLAPALCPIAPATADQMEVERNVRLPSVFHGRPRPRSASAAPGQAPSFTSLRAPSSGFVAAAHGTYSRPVFQPPTGRQAPARARGYRWLSPRRTRMFWTPGLRGIILLGSEDKLARRRGPGQRPRRRTTWCDTDAPM